ncbi:Short-chain dehydrogenase/reductase family protein [Mycena indigotica]|uniref:Short-chain dehydrogenase/reductase family protein n=1 Tax=Mycena indigotica TaxID=2126181 RepID=A0A8H6VZ35_9AGAR|nr:Short-chain dehydrogenase/reductase family protein [Mycena indigotica]KAF7299459.1 Short-chain dehydrogenase/reductase family protein [Mycena indigotica]
MDSPLHPPPRVTALASKPLTTKSAQKRLELFLDDFQARSTASQSGTTTVTVQVEKLQKALKEEREEMKKAKAWWVACFYRVCDYIDENIQNS